MLLKISRKSDTFAMNQLILQILTGMFTVRAGRPDTIDGGGEEATIEDWERMS